MLYRKKGSYNYYSSIIMLITEITFFPPTYLPILEISPYSQFLEYTSVLYCLRRATLRNCVLMNLLCYMYIVTWWEKDAYWLSQLSLLHVCFSSNYMLMTPSIFSRKNEQLLSKSRTSTMILIHVAKTPWKCPSLNVLINTFLCSFPWWIYLLHRPNASF